MMLRLRGKKEPDWAATTLSARLWASALGVERVWSPVDMWLRLQLGVTRVPYSRPLVYIPDAKVGPETFVPLQPAFGSARDAEGWLVVRKPVPEKPWKEFWIVDLLSEQWRVGLGPDGIWARLWRSLVWGWVDERRLRETAAEYGTKETRAILADVIRRAELTRRQQSFPRSRNDSDTPVYTPMCKSSSPQSTDSCASDAAPSRGESPVEREYRGFSDVLFESIDSRTDDAAIADYLEVVSDPYEE